MSILGWLIVAAAAITAMVFYRRSTVPPPVPAGPAPPPNRAIALGAAIVAVALATYLFTAAPPSVADLQPTYQTDFSQDPTPPWVFNVPSQVGWDAANHRLLAKMKVGEGWYGVVPVDWNGGDAFRAEWDITILRRDAGPLPTDLGAVAAVGLFDSSISNIGDTDHVGGSSIIAAFGDTVRLMVSDINLLPRVASGTEKVRLGKPYHVVLTYDRRANIATLTVTDKQSGALIDNLKVEDLRDLSSSINWFGVTMKGFSRNKDVQLPGHEKKGLFIDAAITRVVYAQP
jgi:hypothetical protein